MVTIVTIVVEAFNMSHYVFTAHKEFGIQLC